MFYQETTATRRVAKLSKRVRAVQGGTSASKTVSILIYLITRAQTDAIPTLTSVVAESFPHLRRGAMRDFLLIMQTHGYFKDANWDKTNSVYTFETGSQIEFFSVDQPEKVRGARRDRLFINECNNVSFEAFEELEVRTKEFVFLDWNPTNEFWFYEYVINRPDCEHIILTYKDNEALDPQIIATIEARRERKGWWQVYGLGQLGEVEGKIYRDWAIIDAIPHEARLERYGLDFGYSNDPTAIVAVYRYNNGYIVDEITFTKGLLNKQIADIILNYPQAIVVADSAEPKSIDEIASFGVTVVPAQKGKDSVRNGIQLVQAQRISVTKRSVNVIKEYRNYLWATDRDGKYLSPNEPEHTWSHSMDAIRYAISSLAEYMPAHLHNRMEDQFARNQSRMEMNNTK
jgi:phage terminase large subunit